MKLYPAIITVELQITDGNGTEGTARYQCPLGRLPTEDDMPKIIEKIAKHLPPEFRLMGRHESMMHFLRTEKHYGGPTLSPPVLGDGEEWHDPETANTIVFDGRDFEEDEE